MRSWARAALVWIGSLMWLVGCGSGGDGVAQDAGIDDAGIPDEYEGELFDSTVVLDADSLDALDSVERDGRLRFTGVPEQLATLEPMQVLMGEPNEVATRGLLRLVTAVSEESDGLVIDTVEAPIQLAFRKLHVRLARSTDDAAPVFDAPPGVAAAVQPLWASEQLDEYVFNGDDDPATTQDQVHVTGSLAGGFDYQFGLDVDWGDVFDIPGKVLDCIAGALTGSGCDPNALLPEAVVSLSFDAGADAELGLEGVAFLEYSREDVLGEAKLDWIRAGPLWFRPTVEVRGGFSGAASSQFRLGEKAVAHAKASLSFSSKSGGKLVPPMIDKELSAPVVEATQGAEAKVRVGPRLHLRLFDVFGPFASLYAFAELEADRQHDPCYTLYGGIEGDVGASIVTPDLPVVGSLLLASYAEPFGVARTEVDSGACGTVSGEGPGGQIGAQVQDAFANPTFTPWAFAIDAVVDGYPHQGPGGQVEWTSLVPTIDGRVLVAGSDALQLLKVDPDGQLVWSRGYVADVDFWADTLIPDLLTTAVASTADARLLLVAHPYTLVELDQYGAVLRARRFDVPYYRETWLRLRDAVPDGEGGFYVVGTYSEDEVTPLNDADIWLLRIDPHGTPLWSRRIGDAMHGEISRMLTPVAGGVLVGGSEWKFDGAAWRGLVARFAADGTRLWGTRLIADDCGGGYEQRIHVMSGLESSDGDFIFGAAVEHAGFESAIFKLKQADGALAWSNLMRSSTFNHLGPWMTSLVQLPTSGFLATGVYAGDMNAEDVWVAGLDAVGGVQWIRLYGGANVDDVTGMNDDTYPSIALTQDGGALVAAYSDALGDPNGMWMMKLQAKDGAIDFTAGGPAAQADVAVEAGGACLTAETWDPPISELEVPLVDLVVRPHAASPHILPLTP